MKTKLILSACILFLCFTNIKAQTTTNSFTPSHLKAAERMLDASGMLGHMQQLFAGVIQNQANTLPEDKRAVFIKVMQQFFAKYVTDDEIKKAFIPIYASEYSEDELNKISDFLLTPAGKAMTDKQPDLMNKGMAWGQNLGMAHKAELEDMMKQAFNEK